MTVDKTANGDQAPAEGTPGNPADAPKEELTAEQLQEMKAEVEEEKKRIHEEKSAQGRQFKRFSDTMEKFIEKLDTTQQMGYTPPAPEPKLSESDYLTVGDLQRLQAEEHNKQVSAQKQFNDVYIKTLAKEAEERGLDDETTDKIIHMTTKDPTFNVRSHSAPDAAAKINLQSALISLIGDGKTIPGRRDPKLPPKGDKDTTPANKEPEITLDDGVKQFMKQMNVTEEVARERIKKGLERRRAMGAPLR